MPNCFSKVDVPFYVPVRVPVCGNTLSSDPLAVHAETLKAEIIRYLGSDSKLRAGDGEGSGSRSNKVGHISF